MVTTAEEIVERTLSRGAAALTEAELLAMLLHRGQLGDMALAKARGLLEACGGLQSLLTCDASVARAQELDRLQSAAVLAAVELSRRLARIEVSSSILDDTPTATRYIYLHFGRLNQIVMGAVFLNNQFYPVGQVDAFRGIHTTGFIDPRPILREAIRRNSHGVLLFSTRPSGEPTLTKQDVAFAKRMESACQLVGLELHDYLVLGGDRSRSWRRSGPW